MLTFVYSLKVTIHWSVEFEATLKGMQIIIARGTRVLHFPRLWYHWFFQVLTTCWYCVLYIWKKRQKCWVAELFWPDRVRLTNGKNTDTIFFCNSEYKVSRLIYRKFSTTLGLASKGCNMQRNISVVSKNKFFKTQLLGSPLQCLADIQNCGNPRRVLASHISFKCNNSSYSRSLCLRKINTHLLSQSSSCTTDVKHHTENRHISKVIINLAEMTKTLKYIWCIDYPTLNKNLCIAGWRWQWKFHWNRYWSRIETIKIPKIFQRRRRRAWT